VFTPVQPSSLQSSSSPCENPWAEFSLTIPLWCASPQGYVFPYVGAAIFVCDSPAVVLTFGWSQLSVGYLLASTFYTAMSVLNGQSRPNQVAAAFVIGAWVVCVPIAYPLSHAIHPVCTLVNSLNTRGVFSVQVWT
jgi:hypothetical protein